MLLILPNCLMNTGLKDLLKGIFQVSQGGFKEGQKGILSALKEDVKYHRDYFVYYKNPLFFKPIRNVFLTAILFLDRGSASTTRKNILPLKRKLRSFQKILPQIWPRLCLPLSIIPKR